VAFAHGSGSSRRSRRNQEVAAPLREAGFVTLLMDLLTPEEERVDVRTREHRFDIPLLASRVAATAGPETVAAVVSSGGPPDLAGEALPGLQAPTLMIVGGNDP
jgi:putative phosphoribosyl transferase